MSGFLVSQFARRALQPHRRCDLSASGLTLLPGREVTQVYLEGRRI